MNDDDTGEWPSCEEPDDYGMFSESVTTWSWMFLDTLSVVLCSILLGTEIGGYALCAIVAWTMYVDDNRRLCGPPVMEHLV